jgi:hypothetical protein
MVTHPIIFGIAVLFGLLVLKVEPIQKDSTAGERIWVFCGALVIAVLAAISVWPPF